jgi:hypothetical protein
MDLQFEIPKTPEAYPDGKGAHHPSAEHAACEYLKGAVKLGEMLKGEKDPQKRESLIKDIYLYLEVAGETYAFVE